MATYRIVVEKHVTEVYELEADSEREAVKRLESERPEPIRRGSTDNELGQVVAVVRVGG